MKRKLGFSTELAYVLGILFLALGTALMERAGFGLSMVVAPAYIIHLKVAQTLRFYTFGMSEYVFQAALLIAICIVMRRFRKGYLFSFVTAVIYGFVLDGFMALVALVPGGALALRAVFFVAGLLLGSCGVAFMFHTYITPEAYELFVKELAEKTGRQTGRVKLAYDLSSLVLGVALSFIFFGFGVFCGINWATVLCAFVNGPIINLVSRAMEARFEFRDALPLRRYFE